MFNIINYYVFFFGIINYAWYFECKDIQQQNDNNSNNRYLSRVFFSLKEEQTSHSLVRPLPHFFGALAKTKGDYITENGDLVKFINIVNESANINNNKSAQSSLELRASLWAIGMIGSSKTGLQLLNNTKINNINVVDTISIRGLYVLGLLSRIGELTLTDTKTNSRC